MAFASLIRKRWRRGARKPNHGTFLPTSDGSRPTATAIAMIKVSWQAGEPASPSGRPIRRKPRRARAGTMRFGLHGAMRSRGASRNVNPTSYLRSVSSMPHRQMRHLKKRRKQRDHRRNESGAAVKSASVQLHIDEGRAARVIGHFADLAVPMEKFRRPVAASCSPVSGRSQLRFNICDPPGLVQRACLPGPRACF